MKLHLYILEHISKMKVGDKNRFMIFKFCYIELDIRLSVLMCTAFLNHGAKKVFSIR